MSTIFSPSAALHETLPVRGENISLFLSLPTSKKRKRKRKEGAIERDEHQEGGAGGSVKGAGLARRIHQFRSLHFFFFFSKEVVSGLAHISNRKGGEEKKKKKRKKKRKFNAIFTRSCSEQRRRQPADLHGHLFIFSLPAGTEVFHLPAAPSEEFDRSAGIWSGEIRPICAGNETAWRGHNGNYIRQARGAAV